MDTRGNTDPAEARDVAEFLAMLRDLKERRGLTYRKLEQRAAEQGEALARSTLADALSGRRLPRPDVLSVFVRACGESGDRATAWLDARADVAARARTAKTEPAPAGSAATEQAPPRGAAAPAPTTGTAPRPSPPFHPTRTRSTRRTPLLIVSAIALALATAAITAWMATSGNPASDPAPQPEAPSRNVAVPAGWIRIRPAAAPALCVTDGRVQDGRYASLVAVQRPCGDVAPQRTELEPVGTDTYRIAWVHPQHGKGCLKALSGGAADGLLEPWESCAQASSFRIEPAPASAPDPVPGSGSEPSGTTRRANGGKSARYIFRADGGQCLGVRDARTATGAEVTLQRCTGRENQTFLIDPAP